MKDIFGKLNKVFENRVRLGIMSLLMVNEKLDFNQLKKMLQVTDGNLASHINILEKNTYITVTKGFIGKKTQTIYETTTTGREEFSSHIDALEQIIKGIE